MAEKSYGIENLSFRDKTRKDDYLLERVAGASTFNMPVNMNECSYMFPSELTEIICKDNLQERELDRYTAGEVENLIQDLKFDVQEHIKDATVSVVDTTSDINTKTVLLNSEHLVFTKVNNE